MCDTVLYFAYGSNLNKQQMTDRTGQLPEAQKATLPDYRFVFNKISCKDHTLKANIEPADGETVFGVVYSCNSDDMKEISEKEGAPNHYSPEWVRVETENGSVLEAKTYIACEKYIQEHGHPSDEYVDLIVTGAEEHGLPAEYIETIKAAAEANAEQ